MTQLKIIGQKSILKYLTKTQIQSHALAGTKAGAAAAAASACLAAASLTCRSSRQHLQLPLSGPGSGSRRSYRDALTEMLLPRCSYRETLTEMLLPRCSYRDALTDPHRQYG